MANPGPSVAITIVTFNSARYIRHCLEHALAQDYPRLRIVVVDNASSDGTAALLERFDRQATIAFNQHNSGFAGGQNQAIALAGTDWILALNPDVRLLPDFVRQLVQAGEADQTVGTVCGKLLAMASDFSIPVKPIFDSAGIFMTPNLRHLDRGSQLPDQGQFNRNEYVFGATGAAALYRRRMIEDVSVEGEFFDSDFFAYREDADVAWRAQLLGWRCLYAPSAVAYHVRSVLPLNRRSLPAIINMHSVKNRFLLRIKNTTADLYRRNWWPMTVRDITVVAGCLFYEFTSLRAFPLIFRKLAPTWRKRQAILRRRRVEDAYIAAWFSNQPVSYPAAGIPTMPVEGEKMASR